MRLSLLQSNISAVVEGRALISTSTPPPRSSVCRSSSLTCCPPLTGCALQGQHNADEAAQHAQFLLQRYMSRQELLAQVNAAAAELQASNDRKLLHVTEVNAGLADTASKVKSRTASRCSGARRHLRIAL